MAAVQPAAPEPMITTLAWMVPDMNFLVKCCRYSRLSSRPRYRATRMYVLCQCHARNANLYSLVEPQRSKKHSDSRRWRKFSVYEGGETIRPRNNVSQSTFPL